MRRLILLVAAVVVLIGLFFVVRPGAQSEGPQTRTVALAIQGDTMSPAEITATEGDTVALRLTADRAVELHLHGYDLEQAVEPGQTAELSFDAKLTGRFEFEDEAKQTKLGVLVVQPR